MPAIEIAAMLKVAGTARSYDPARKTGKRLSYKKYVTMTDGSRRCKRDINNCRVPKDLQT